MEKKESFVAMYVVRKQHHFGDKINTKLETEIPFQTEIEKKNSWWPSETNFDTNKFSLSNENNFKTNIDTKNNLSQNI